MIWYEVVNQFMPQWLVAVQGIALIVVAVRAFYTREMYIINHWHILGIGLAAIPMIVFYSSAIFFDRELEANIALSRISWVFMVSIVGTILLLASWGPRGD
jgi:hypothetical protein